MKINNTPPVGQPGSTEATSPGTKTPPGAQKDNTPTSSSISLESLQNTDRNDIDLQRVNEIRDAIREGRLDINTGKIADGLLNSVRDLLDNRR